MGNQAELRQKASRQEYYDTLLSELIAVEGELMSGAGLYRALGFKTADGLRRARDRENLQVRVFDLPNRRGAFAMTRDVAEWLCSLRFDHGNQTEDQGGVEQEI